jgi:uncharacterized membrane-anchored protein
MIIVRIALALVLFALVSPSTALAGPPAKKAAPVASASASASAAPEEQPAPKPEFMWREGPMKVDLGHDLDIDLPEGYGFLGMPEAKRLMEKLGNFHNETLLGLVTAKREDAQWLITIRYEDAGYVKDDEKIDADALLEAIREGTEEANKEREEHGFAALHVGGWAEPPRYDKAAHHLVWALTASSADGASVNYNTRVLGRRGFVALNLLTDPAELAANKPEAHKILAATHYRAGARYEDFDSSKDKVAEYGLVGLVLGGAGLGAAKLVKVGILAKLGKGLLALLVAGKKAIVALFVGAAALFKKIFGGNKKAEE